MSALETAARAYVAVMDELKAYLNAKVDSNDLDPTPELADILRRVDAAHENLWGAAA